MIINFPDHKNGPWLATPWWLFWKPRQRRKHWRWIMDHKGCYCDFYWQYDGEQKW